MDQPTIGVHQSAIRRHRPNTRFSHFEGSWNQLTVLVAERLCSNEVVSGTVPGAKVLRLVGDVCKNFYSMHGAERLMQGMYKPVASSVKIVLYDREVLGEEASTDCDMEIVSIEAAADF